MSQSWDLAHLGHLELPTPKPEESPKLFVDVTESGREGGSVYLRAYDDYERHTLKLTASKLPGMGHVAYAHEVRRRCWASYLMSSERLLGGCGVDTISVIARRKILGLLGGIAQPRLKRAPIGIPNFSAQNGR